VTRLFRKVCCAVRSRRARKRENPDDRHHAAIFVFGDMAMVNKVANVRSAEVDPYVDLRVRVIRVAIPIRNLNGVEVLAFDRAIGLSAV
jgi:hypothetical protein